MPEFDGTDLNALPPDGEKFTIPVEKQVPAVYDPPDDNYVITPTLLKTNRGGDSTEYNIGGGIAYSFNKPSPYCLVMRSDHLKQLLLRYGPQGRSSKELVVVAEKDWPEKWSYSNRKGDEVEIPLSFKSKVLEYRAERDKEHAKLFPEFAKKLLGKK